MNIDQYLEQFEPYRDQSDWVSEDPQAYADRMQATLLPHWPAEVLIEWLHRHARNLEPYAFLKFERFRFSRQEWELKDIPGREAFADPGFCDNFKDIAKRAQYKYDWLAIFMMKNGTWNTPIILLEVNEQIIAPSRLPLNRPLHCTSSKVLGQDSRFSKGHFL